MRDREFLCREKCSSIKVYLPMEDEVILLLHVPCSKFLEVPSQVPFPKQNENPHHLNQYSVTPKTDPSSPPWLQKSSRYFSPETPNQHCSLLTASSIAIPPISSASPRSFNFPSSHLTRTKSLLLILQNFHSHNFLLRLIDSPLHLPL